MSQASTDLGGEDSSLIGRSTPQPNVKPPRPSDAQPAAESPLSRPPRPGKGPSAAPPPRPGAKPKRRPRKDRAGDESKVPAKAAEEANDSPGESDEGADAGAPPAKMPRRPARPGAPPPRPKRPAKAPDQAPAAAKHVDRDTADEEPQEEEEHEENSLGIWFRESPAWLTSMVVHAVLLLVLALVGVAVEKPKILTEIGLFKAEDPEKLEEPDNEPEKKLETDVKTDVEALEVVTNDVSAADFKIDAPAEVPNEQDQKELAAVQVDINPLAEGTVVVGDALAEIGGVSTTGKFGGRTAAGRARLGRRKGGNGASESAVELALKWLAAHQNSDGSWHYDHRHGVAGCTCGNPGAAKGSYGSTGLGLLPFLSAGYTHKDGKYKGTVEKGLNHLVTTMKVDAAAKHGKMLDEGHAGMYAHGLATLALTEAYGMTRDPKLRDPAQAAVNWIVQSQSADANFWGYTGGGGDTSVSGWQIMALKSAYLSYLTVPDSTIQRIKLGLDRVSSEGGAFYGYTGPGKTPPMTSVGLLGRMYLGWPRNTPALGQGINYISTTGPNLGNMYYTYYANQTMFQYTDGEGEMWKRWNLPMRDGLVASQAKTGHEAGSWNHCSYISSGGRVYSTSLCCMCLQIYYRYVSVYQKGAGAAAPGARAIGAPGHVSEPGGKADQVVEDNFPTQ